MSTYFKLFIGHYKQLRARGNPFPWYYHTGYSMYNCFRWALYNAAHNDLDGNYLWSYSKCGKYKERIREIGRNRVWWSKGKWFKTTTRNTTVRNIRWWSLGRL